MKTKKIVMLILCLLLIFVFINIDISFVYGLSIGNKNTYYKNICKNNNLTYRDYSSTSMNNSGNGNDDLTNKEINNTLITGYNNGYSIEEISYEKLFDGSVYRGGNATSIYQNTGNIDNDPNDFAKILPMANIYIDTTKMENWNNPDNFIIDINDDRFKWSGPSNLIDHNGNSPTVEFQKENQAHPESAIVYYGYLHSYLNYDNNSKTLNNTRAYRSKIYNGTYKDVNVINGTNIIEATNDYLYKITYLDAAILPNGTRGDVVIEVDKVELESTVTTDEKVPIGLESAKFMQVHANYFKNNGERFIPRDVTFTAYSIFNNNSYTRTIRNAVGASTTFKIKIEKDGNPVDGKIAYATKDLDVASFESFWGRRPTDTDVWETGKEFYKYGEGVKINNGALSFAVTPSYDHYFEKNEVSKGKIPIDIFREGKGINLFNSPLRIEKNSSANLANGVRFVTSSTQKIRNNGRGANGSFTGGADFSNGICYNDTYCSKNDFERDNLTFQTFLNSNLEDWGAGRQDGNTYDTGFAVLLNAKESSLTWSGSQHTSSTVDTKLFQSELFRIISLSHGTGGGIYIEDYDTDCNPVMQEENAVLASGTNATITLVPEDGYFVNKFYINNQVYNINEYFTNNQESVHILNTNITIYKNSDNTYDILLENVTDNTSVHVDFEANYYFTKTIKGKVSDAKLNFLATPYIIDVDNNLIKYTAISTKEFSLTKNDAYKIEENEETIWYFKYPSLGDSSKSLPSLPIEVPVSNHTENHVNRIYWFIEETGTNKDNLKLLMYNNTEVVVPAIISNNYYQNTNWYSEASENNIVANNLIKRKTDSAYLSPFISGSNITNVLYYDLTVTKKVTGNNVNKNNEFTFNIKLKDYAGNNVIGGFKLINTNNEEENITTATNGINIQLKHNETITIKDVPTGYSYEIEEMKNDYVTSYEIRSNSNLIKEEVSNIASNHLNSNQTVTFINNKESPVKTGIFMDYSPYVYLILIISLFIFIIKKIRIKL